MITLEKDLKVQMINNRLRNLARQHYDITLDIVQAEANGMTDEVLVHQDRLDKLQNAYVAIEGLITELQA